MGNEPQSDMWRLLNAVHPPAVLYTNQVAWLLGFRSHDISILAGANILKPLGDPARNAPKRFATAAILRLRDNEEWLNKAVKVLAKHWKEKNSDE